MTDIRTDLKQVMAATVEDERVLHNATYLFFRPLGVPTTRRAYPQGSRWRADCSTGVRDVCWWVPGAPDPFQNGWADYGNSSTIFFRMHHEPDLTKVEVGDFFTFGYWTGEHHVVMAYDVTDPHDPLVWGFGGQGQPHIVKLSDEIRYQGGRTTTLCKIPIVDPPPSPQDKLRAMTGFYSWVAWRLSEGPWRHYGKMNSHVRPNVPARISAQWWARYVQFLANRKKGNKP